MADYSYLLPWNTAPGRSIDVELGSSEVITIELDDLDSSADDVIELLKEEGLTKVGYWTRLAGEYLRRGHLDAAKAIVVAALHRHDPTDASAPILTALLANVQLAQARRAPKIKLPNARQDDMSSEQSRDAYVTEATQNLNNIDKLYRDNGHTLSQELLYLTRAIHQLASRSMDDALKSFEAVLAEKPTNVIALVGKGRILYARRQYQAALKIFQHVLQLNPYCLPDPRIGIGLCLWAMGHKEKARAAWQRSMEVNPSEWSAQLLLGLEALNASKNPNMDEEERAREIMTGTKYIERAFNGNQRNAAAANALCDIFLRKGLNNRAMKLAERTIQFADTLTVLTEGYIRAGRVCHAQGLLADAMKHYERAMETGQPKHVVGTIGLAQLTLQKDEIPPAIHLLDGLLQPPNPQRSLEATVMLASLRAFPRPGVSSSDAIQDKARARELFDRLLKTIDQHQHEEGVMHTNGNSQSSTPPSRAILDDLEMYVEIARLWQNENLERTGKMLREALRISEANGTPDPRLLNNLGVLAHFDERHQDARAMYEKALTTAASLGADAAEAISTTVLYNLARVYEDIGETSMASEAYEKLLSRHPEYVDAKIRQAHMLTNLSRHNDAHELLKQALSSQNDNLNLRAFYTYFLIQSNLSKPARDFVFATLKDHDKHDVYSLCVAGWIQYHQSRENRDAKAAEDRKRGFQRSAEFYEKALVLDPMCAVAAQGLAIVTAEDALGTLGGALPPGPSPDEPQKRLVNAREALDIFAKVRESLNDGSVYVNMGHCYYARDEYDRAIESYETASNRYYAGHDVSVLMCLCRSWYSKANKDQSFAAMNTALGYAQKALHIEPSDKAVLYNIAMIQQKAAEMLFALGSSKRTLKDLQHAIEHAGHAQKLFASLAEDSSPSVPYSRDIADQRRKYGDTMLRKSEEHLAAQRQHEAEQQARVEAARQKRQEEKDRQEAIEREREEQLRAQAERLAEERRKAKEDVKAWMLEAKAESDDERERKARKAANKKVKSEAVSGDEAMPSAEPKKRRSRKVKKESGAEKTEDDEGALFTDEEEGDKPAKKRPKKRVIRDDDEEEPTGGPRKKQYKSKEFISDSDEEMS
ncbi:RNA polymerase II-associated protein [Dentipellis sp. KUC8613]|nr:RNA polymerase II-associated protein [Dentipellis sp. KUC8613]